MGGRAGCRIDAPTGDHNSGGFHPALCAMRRSSPRALVAPLDTTRLVREPAGADDHMITRFFFQVNLHAACENAPNSSYALKGDRDRSHFSKNMWIHELLIDVMVHYSKHSDIVSEYMKAFRDAVLLRHVNWRNGLWTTRSSVPDRSKGGQRAN